MPKREQEKGTPLKALVLFLDEILITAVAVFILWKAGIALLPWAPVGFVAFLIIGYLFHYKVLATAFSGGMHVGEEGMVGLTGITVTPLNPEGTIKVRGEMWKAKASSGDLEAGEEIEVEGVEGLELVVRRNNQQRSPKESE